MVCAIEMLDHATLVVRGREGAWRLAARITTLRRMPTLEKIGSERYASLTTFRKDGTPVATPLWVLPAGNGVAFWTTTDSWKVKRVRKNPQVTVQACDLRGRVSGEVVGGTARIGTDEDREHFAKVLGRKYWITGRFGLMRYRMSRNPGRITVIIVDPV